MPDECLPITALVAASASLKDAQRVPERKRINARVRGEVFVWLDRNGYSSTYPRKPTSSAPHDIWRNRRSMPWPSKMCISGHLPVYRHWTRVTIGTALEMEQFQTAWQKVMTGAVTASVGAMPISRKRKLDGIVVRA